MGSTDVQVRRARPDGEALRGGPWLREQLYTAASHKQVPSTDPQRDCGRPAGVPPRLLRRRRPQARQRRLNQDEQRRSRPGPLLDVRGRRPARIRVRRAARRAHLLPAQPRLAHAGRRQGPAPAQEPGGGSPGRPRQRARRRMDVRHRDRERRVRRRGGTARDLQLAPPGAGVRDPQDHLARGGDQARARERAAARQPRRAARLGLRQGLRGSDVADAPARPARGLRDRHRQDQLGTESAAKSPSTRPVSATTRSTSRSTPRSCARPRWTTSSATPPRPSATSAGRPRRASRS